MIEYVMKNVELTLGVVSMRVDECGRACARVCMRARACVRGRICARVDGFHGGGPAGDDIAREKRERARERRGPALSPQEDEKEREKEGHAHAQEELIPVECGVRDSLSRSEVREVVAAGHQRGSGRRARSGFFSCTLLSFSLSLFFY